MSNLLGAAVCAVGLSLTPSLSAQTAALPALQAKVEACYQTAQRVTEVAPSGWSDLQPCLDALKDELDERQQVTTLVNLGLIQTELGDFDAAQSNFDQALSISDAYPGAYLNRANLLYLKKNFAAAIRDYNEALRLDTATADLLYLNRGMAYQNLGEYTLAEMDYRAALAIRPGWILVAEKLQALENQRLSTVFPE